MATWKKLVVSGSDVSQLNNDAGYLTANSTLPAFSSASAGGTIMIADGTNGLLNFTSGTGGLVITGDAGTDTITFSHNGIVSSSEQIDDLFNIDGLVSASVLTSPGQGEALLTTNGQAGSVVDLGLQTTDSPEFVDLTLTGNAAIAGNAVVTGNLTVQGDTFQAQVTNLNIEDKYILLNSGSSTIGDSGVVFGGSNGTANSGAAVVWDASYNSNDGRLSIVNTLASDASTDVTPSYHVAGVFEGTEAAAATAQADHKGNIRVMADESIWIYS